MRTLRNPSSMSTEASERRGSDRFPIVRDVRYKLLNGKTGLQGGTGKTINISSTGVLFSAQEPLVPGRRLEISISWPAQLDGKCGLKLVVRGRVVRCKDTLAAIETEKYEFRTVGSDGLGVLSCLQQLSIAQRRGAVAK